MVHVSVRLVENDSAVLVRAENWGIHGSELIEKLNLNRRFSLAFTARLSWTPAATCGSGRQIGNGIAAPAAGTGVVLGLRQPQCAAVGVDKLDTGLARVLLRFWRTPVTAHRAG